MADANITWHYFVAAFTAGKGLVAGASAIGLGALCFYGLGLSNDVGAVDRAAYVLILSILINICLMACYQY